MSLLDASERAQRGEGEARRGGRHEGRGVTASWPVVAVALLAALLCSALLDSPLARHPLVSLTPTCTARQRTATMLALPLTHSLSARALSLCADSRPAIHLHATPSDSARPHPPLGGRRLLPQRVALLGLRFSPPAPCAHHWQQHGRAERTSRQGNDETRAAVAPIPPQQQQPQRRPPRPGRRCRSAGRAGTATAIVHPRTPNVSLPRAGAAHTQLVVRVRRRPRLGSRHSSVALARHKQPVVVSVCCGSHRHRD